MSKEHEELINEPIAPGETSLKEPNSEQPPLVDQVVEILRANPNIQIVGQYPEFDGVYPDKRGIVDIYICANEPTFNDQVLNGLLLEIQSKIDGINSRTFHSRSINWRNGVLEIGSVEVYETIGFTTVETTTSVEPVNQFAEKVYGIDPSVTHKSVTNSIDRRIRVKIYPNYQVARKLLKHLHSGKGWKGQTRDLDDLRFRVPAPLVEESGNTNVGFGQQILKFLAGK